MVQRHLTAIKQPWGLRTKFGQELLGMTAGQVAKVETSGGTKGLLTIEQEGTWARLTAERAMPAEPPELKLPSQSENDAMMKKFMVLSGVFRALRESPIGLSDRQRVHLYTLQQIVAVGLYWNNAGGADSQNTTETEIVRHAEQLLLLGVLTEDQAKQVQFTMSKAAI